MRDFEFVAFDADAVADAVRQQPLSALRQHARARRRRRVAGWSIAAVSVLGTALAVPLTLGGTDSRPATPTASGPIHEPQTVLGDLMVFTPQTAVGVQISGCTIRFTVTTDGGHTWSPYRAPNDVCVGSGVVRPMDGSYQVLDAQTYLVGAGPLSYLTHDAGQIWRDTASSTTAVDVFPTGAKAVGCESVSCAGRAQPLALDPASGSLLRLRSGQPPGAIISAYSAAGGALWAIASPTNTTSLITWSTNNGASWQSAQPPAGTTATAISARNTKEAYVLLGRAASTTNSEIPTSQRLLRTTDGGKTWDDIITNLSPTSIIRPFTVSADGTVLVADTDGTAVWTSTDGGAHFTKGPAIPPGSPRAANGLMWIIGEHGSAQMTTDGQHWQTLALPTA
jgi:photosystem II stability/assembly factor-like uncharacterized protein